MFNNLTYDPLQDQNYDSSENCQSESYWSDYNDYYFFEPEPLNACDIPDDDETSQETCTNINDTSQSNRNQPDDPSVIQYSHSNNNNNYDVNHCSSNEFDQKDQQFDSFENKSNSQPCEAWLDDNQNQKSNLFGDRHRKPKTKLFLSDSTKKFKKDFYSRFTSKKKFKKEFVKDIHNTILVEKIKGFRKMRRDEIRMIDQYFINYAPFQDQILQVLKDNHDIILKKILNF